MIDHKYKNGKETIPKIKAFLKDEKFFDKDEDIDYIINIISNMSYSKYFSTGKIVFKEDLANDVNFHYTRIADLIEGYSFFRCYFYTYT